VFLLQHVPEPVQPRCKRWAGHLGKQHLISNDRARKALSLLLVPAKSGDKDGGPVAAEKLFDQMEIYPGVDLRSDRSLVKMVCNVNQDLRRSISASCTKRRGYPTQKWSA
jgi:hypothetical protein